jgi:hypothetical protein
VSQLRVAFTGQVVKESAFPEANEDACELAVETGRIAVSDGASESFDSKSWANQLALKYVSQPEVNAAWLDEAIASHVAQFDHNTLSWSKQAAFERGSFATLIGIQYNPELNLVEILAIGDSLVVLLDGPDLVKCFPYARAEDFRQCPVLISTNTAQNAAFDLADPFSRNRAIWTLADYAAPSVLCMTDALGEWALRKEEDGGPSWTTLLGIETQADLESLVARERDARNMRVDDVTLVKLTFEVA